MSDDQRTAEQARMFANRLTKRARHLRKWARREGVTCYRVYDRDIPEVPLAVDWYEGRLHVAEYARPHDRTPAQHDAWLDAMAAAAAEALGAEPGAVWMKRRERQRGKAQYGRFGDEEAWFVVGEAGLKLRVNLSDYLDTGLFLDHRPLRERVAEEARGKDFLNLFAYTGAFTLHAIAGGAKTTRTVDMSATYIGWAAENLRLNKFDPTGPQHELVQADVLTWLKEEGQSPRRYDLIVCDPPTFSTSKRMEDTFDVQRDHAAILADVAGVARPRAVCYFSTNFRKFTLDEATVARDWAIEDLGDSTVPEDFRNKRIHSAWRLVRR